MRLRHSWWWQLEQIYFNTGRDAKKFKTEPCVQVSYSVEEDYVDDSKSLLAEIKGEDIDITSDSNNDEDELVIL